MNPDSTDLAALLDRMALWLGRPELIFPADEVAADLAGRANELADLIRQADDRLVVGLVGGTGVGKSTLINALAGRVISTSAVMRPTTDHPVIYRHRNNTFSLNVSGGPETDVHQHDVAALARITLADFPDFDSLEPGHRAMLASCFPRLDLLIWVVDPVKYADRTFYDWLTAAPQARVNSIFVLNKTDELQRRYGPRSSGVTAEVVRDFSSKLREFAKWPNPEVLAFSALTVVDAPDGRHQPGFQALTRRLGELTESKRRRTVKELNGMARAAGLLEELAKAVPEPEIRTISARLATWTQDVRGETADLLTQSSLSFRAHLARPWRRLLTTRARAQTPWPLDFILYISSRLPGRTSLGDQTMPAGEPLPEAELPLRRVGTWTREIQNASPGVPSWTGQALVRHLAGKPKPEGIIASAGGELRREALTAAEDLARRHHWRLRHHVLPLLALVYPFLPFVAAWIGARLTETGPQLKPTWHLAVAWTDSVYILVTVLFLYLLQTFYYLYRLDKSANTSLDRLAANWVASCKAGLEAVIFGPLDELAREMSAELDQLDLILDDGARLLDRPDAVRRTKR